MHLPLLTNIIQIEPGVGPWGIRIKYMPTFSPCNNPVLANWLNSGA